MARWFALAAAALTVSSMVWAGDELPKSDQGESFEVEPPLLIPYREPGAPLAGASATPAIDLARLTREVDRARRSALSAERLFRMGALAKIEAEQRALKAVRLQSDLENARLALAKEATSAPADAELARAIETAHAAARKREQAELEAAEIDLTRQQKLLSLGIGRKARVAQAERKLAELKGAGN